MGERLNLNKESTAILLYNKDKNIFEDKTENITAIYTAHYFRNFTGYNIYFSGSKQMFFYPKDSVKILQKVESIDITKYDVYVNHNLIPAVQVDKFEGGHYRVKTISKSIFTQTIRLESNQYMKIYDYYKALAEYAEQISNQDEPLYYLAKNYKRIAPNRDSVLFDYLKGKFKKEYFEKPIILPFDYNQSQYQAIEQALTHNISVIEGPPGTGKTQTILNLIVNIISRGQKVAVISNNNSAIDNVFEKLQEEGYDFFAAKLGSKNNVEQFFEQSSNVDLKSFLDSYDRKANKIYKKDIEQLIEMIKRVNELEVELATLKNDLNQLEQEKKNFNSISYNKVHLNDRLSPDEYIQLIRRIETPKKLGFIIKIILRYKYKVNINDIKIHDLLYSLEEAYYYSRIKDYNYKINKVEKELSTYNKDHAINILKKKSKSSLLNDLYDSFSIINISDFSEKNFKVEFQSFIERYPVILSTSQSVLNNAPKSFLFDYLIVDEASQGDLLSSVIAMSCAKRLVVVGDSRQLQQIDEERLFEQSEILAQKYNVPLSYRYESNSILMSVRQSVKDVSITLLKEHYRCAPDIINFCNQMFYDNELIPMTKNYQDHIRIIKTVPGNHARKNPNGTGMYNQREIDEIKDLIFDTHSTSIGVITPFRYQANLICEALQEKDIEADTVHKYQGRQKDEIILSFVVNSLDKNPEQVENRLYDFITNEKLLNVAISRGKSKVTAIVSDKVYYSKNNIIHDFIKYAEYLYGNKITSESKITSVFDQLYAEHTKEVNKIILNKPKVYETEIIMKDMIDKILKEYKCIGYAMHIRLSRIVNDYSGFDEEEKKYIMHPWTHVDFLFYHKVSKEKLFVLEVDGIKFHEQNKHQSLRDEIKDRVLKLNEVDIHRFRTNESREEDRLKSIIRAYVA
jgi:superfamily I DNA and/or RNA helicase